MKLACGISDIYNEHLKESVVFYAMLKRCNAPDISCLRVLISGCMGGCSFEALQCIHDHRHRELKQKASWTCLTWPVTPFSELCSPFFSKHKVGTWKCIFFLESDIYAFLMECKWIHFACLFHG